MHYLQSVYANGNRLTEFPGQLFLLPVLFRLDLSNNQLAAIPREVASLYGTLIELSIQGNQIPMDQIAWFIEAMPNTEIRF